MSLDGIMVHGDQYLIYCSTLDRWALLLWGKVCVLKGRKANIHFIRKQENWMLGIRKSMITVFALLQVKSGGFKSIHRHDGVDLLCLTVTVYPVCIHLIHSLFFMACPHLSIPQWIIFLFLFVEISVNRWFQNSITGQLLLLHIDRKNTIKNLITIADVTRCSFPLSVQRLVPRLISSFFFGVIHLHLSNSVSISTHHDEASF